MCLIEILVYVILITRVSVRFHETKGLKCLQYLRETSVISDLCYIDVPCAHAVVH